MYKQSPRAKSNRKPRMYRASGRYRTKIRSNRIRMAFNSQIALWTIRRLNPEIKSRKQITAYTASHANMRRNVLARQEDAGITEHKRNKIERTEQQNTRGKRITDFCGIRKISCRKKKTYIRKPDDSEFVRDVSKASFR